MELAGLDLLAIALKVGNLTTMGKENEIVNFDTGPDFTDSQAAVGFCDSLGLRGEKRR